MESMKESEQKRILEEAISATNEKARQYEDARGNLFAVVKESVQSIGSGEDVVKKYKDGIEEQHRSTVYVMITSATDPLLQKFELNLPKSYQTLYEIQKLKKAIGEDRCVKLISDGTIHSSMSKADVTKLRGSERKKTSSGTGEDNVVCGQSSGEEVVTLQVDAAEPVATSSFEEIKEQFEKLDDEVKQRFVEYVLDVTRQQQEAA